MLPSSLFFGIINGRKALLLFVENIAFFGTKHCFFRRETMPHLERHGGCFPKAAALPCRRSASWPSDAVLRDPLMQCFVTPSRSASSGPHAALRQTSMPCFVAAGLLRRVGVCPDGRLSDRENRLIDIVFAGQRRMVRKKIVFLFPVKSCHY